MILTLSFGNPPAMDAVQVKFPPGSGARFSLVGTTLEGIFFQLYGVQSPPSRFGGVQLAFDSFGLSLVDPTPNVSATLPFTTPPGAITVTVKVLVPDGVPFSLQVGDGPTVNETGNGRFEPYTLPVAPPEA